MSFDLELFHIQHRKSYTNDLTNIHTFMITTRVLNSTGNTLLEHTDMGSNIDSTSLKPNY